MAHLSTMPPALLLTAVLLAAVPLAAPKSRVSRMPVGTFTVAAAFMQLLVLALGALDAFRPASAAGPALHHLLTRGVAVTQAAV
jgi:hypothetical protein